MAQAGGTAPVLKTLYPFPGGGDGLVPWGGLVNASGTFYGTSFSGGAYGRGTVFRITPATGAETTLFTVDGGAHGGNPQGGVIDAGGVLHGTTASGGKSGAGAIFAYATTSNVEDTLYGFTGGTDGSGPTSTLIDLGGILFGTA